ncbi:MAG: ComF family protein [Candidatus Omnitrophica bacterium]|nr:ComF family protein [Candidatus Omnitrophota bacterium]
MNCEWNIAVNPKQYSREVGHSSTLTKKLASGIILPMQFSISTLPKTIIDATLELIYPRFCLICRRGLEQYDKFSLCEACRKGIKRNVPPLSEGCGDNERYFDSVKSVTAYEGVMRECIHKFKYNGSLALEGLFADLLTDFAEKHIDVKRFDCIIPVPLSRVKLRERTFNQAEILASSLSRKFGLPCINNNLIRAKSGKSQITLSKSERLKDIKGAFKVKNSALLKDKSVLLVDDVFTTGATVRECSKMLKESGVKYIEVLTLARGI